MMCGRRLGACPCYWFATLLRGSASKGSLRSDPALSSLAEKVGIRAQATFRRRARRRVANQKHVQAPSRLPHIVVIGLAFVPTVVLTTCPAEPDNCQGKCQNKRQAGDNDVRQVAGRLGMQWIRHSSSGLCVERWPALQSRTF
jgi:hypothetical protein